MQTLRLHSLSLVLSLALAAVSAEATLAETTQTQNQPAPAQGPFHFLSQQQRIMMFVDMGKATASMTDDQKRAWRRDQRQKVMAMSDSEKQAYAAKLQSEWDALPADQRAQARQQAEAFRAERMKERGTMQGQGAGGGGE